MKLQDIQLFDISRYRANLMGLAILIIILFHVSLPRSSSFYGLCRMGNVGVDIFLFLSGMGLWFSWVKTPSVKHFFARRYLRIYPAYFIVALVYFIHQGNFNVLYLIGNLTINTNFWLYGDLTFWFLPAIMLLYAVAPFYIKLISRYGIYSWLPVLMIIWCIMVQWIQPLHATFFQLEIFLSRIPIFFLGINIGRFVMEKRTIDRHGIFLLILFFAVSLGTCIYLEQQLHGIFPLFIERMVYIPLAVTLILVLNFVFKHIPVWLNTCLTFVGGISLEIYLLHVEFVMKFILSRHLGYWLTALLTIVITIPLAWLLHKAILLVENAGKRNKIKA